MNRRRVSRQPRVASVKALKRPTGGGAERLLKVGSDFYVLGSAAASRRTTRVLANAQAFAVFDLGGDIIFSPLEALGFFNRDTRYLSRFELMIAGQTPYFLNSYLSGDKAEFRINLTNPDLTMREDVIRLPRDSIQVERSWVLLETGLFHRLIVRNFAAQPVQMPFEFLFGVDFADLFEVRGVKRDRSGKSRPPEVDGNKIRFVYRGLDNVTRTSEIEFDTRPDTIRGDRASFLLDLKPHDCVKLETHVSGGPQDSTPQRRHPENFQVALAERNIEIAKSHTGWARLTTGNKLFDTFVQQSTADLSSIVTSTPEGTFIMAGIPWFGTLFGRDSLITALSLLPFNPDLALRTLTTLAGLQGTVLDESRDEQPGKIVHEIRAGEMAATGEIPFARYYGSCDATLLFLWLYGRCVDSVGDLKFAEELWPNVVRALEWIERWGDSDGDGYVEYMRQTPKGLANQGWKDSFDAISHADGELARPPIALAEVQGYLYAGYLAVARVAERLSHPEVAKKLTDRAAALKDKFARDFWWDHERTVALALDGDKRPCRVMASNAAHCLATGIIDGERAEALADRLLADDMFSGWGIRTLGTNEHRYNPMSYHNGSVWPHDNAIAALGLSRTKNRAGIVRILEGLFEASLQFQAGSLPELFCGFAREEHRSPVPYPVACQPQAWAASSVFLLIQAMLGMEVHGLERRVVFDCPATPTWLEWLRIDDLKVGDSGSVSLMARHTAHESGVEIEVMQTHGPVSVEIKKPNASTHRTYW